MNAFALRVHSLLQSGIRAPSVSLPQVVSTIVVFGLLYGAAMGTFGGFQFERANQVVFSAVKVPILLLLTFAISLPSFFVLNALLGVAEDFGETLRVLLTTQAVLSVVLASLSPFTLLWYVSSSHYSAAILFNALMFAVAGLTAQSLLRFLYRPLIARNTQHRHLLRVWLFIYGFVGIQMGYVLRPFVGNPSKPVTLFRTDAWDNAYVVVLRLIWDVLSS